mmetsp:Transcript_17637/g.21373  ORF Transcript_17637/g.21373 Transcript_17637/m.21373 type:complete len:966 (-) Transcript_17637:1702-4599(-)
MSEKKGVKIKVPSKDPKTKESQEPQWPENKPIQDEEEVVEGLSPEDTLLKEKLETAVRKLTEKKATQQRQQEALDVLELEIQSATASMTSVPKPLKFLRPFYDDLKSLYKKKNAVKTDELLKSLADVLSVLGMTMAEEGTRECLKFKLLGHRTDLGAWGHEFIRSLSGEISQEYAARTTADPPQSIDDLIELVDVIIPFQMQQNSETEAVDLLFEVDRLDKLTSTTGLVDSNNYERVCLYLLRFAEFLFDFNDLESVMGVAFKLYFSQEQYPDALRVAMRINDLSLVKKVMDAAQKKDPLQVKQLALMLGTQKMFGHEEEDEGVNNLISNATLSRHFQDLALNLNMDEAKSPEDVYKTYLSDSGFMGQQAESARQNLASTFVNAFVNCGFQKDSLMMTGDTESTWIYKNKNEGMISAAASLGMVLLWNVNSGMDEIDKFLYVTGENGNRIKAGALLGMGIVNCGVRDDSEAAYAVIVMEFEKTTDKMVRMCGVLGLGLAYAGNPFEGAMNFLLQIVEDDADEADIELQSMAGLALGLMYIGTGEEKVAEAIISLLFSVSMSETKASMSMTRFLCLGLALVYLGKQDEADKFIVTSSSLPNSQLAQFTSTLMEVCAYAGSGNVIQVQKLMHICAQHLGEDGKPIVETDGDAKAEDDDDEAKDENKDDAADAAAAAEPEEPAPIDKEKAARAAIHQSIAVLGVALITMGESVGRQMAERTFQHLLQYGDLAVRRAVPLAMALSHISDPDYALIDVLSKLSHDGDKDTAMCAIMALGIMCAGTTNSKVADMLRNLAQFYKDDNSPLFVVRLAQGLLFSGKGLVTLAPFHSDRTLLSGPALGGILTVMLACLDFKSTLLGKYHFLMYTLACAIRPRMMMTLVEGEGEPDDENPENLEFVKVKVRVGQAVETVGQAGKPKRITGFQTQETPVLLNVGDRVELATDEYEPLTSVLEGLVVLRKKKKQSTSS